MISTELERIQKAKADIRTAIEAKGVSVPPESLLSAYPSKIAEIPAGGGLDYSGTGYGDIQKSAVDSSLQEDLRYTSIKFSEWKPSTVFMESRYEDDKRLVFCPAIDTSSVNNMNRTFSGCISLRYIPDTFSTQNVTLMAQMFNNCISLRTIPDTFSTSKVIDMYGIFSGCGSLEAVPSTFDSSQAKTMKQAFSFCSSLTEIPANVSTASATDIDQMFEYCDSLVSIKAKIDLTNVDSMRSIFDNCPRLNEVHFKGTLKPECIIDEIFGYSPSETGTMYIPAGKRTEYQRIIERTPSTWTVVEE